ncbi:isoaspartyl peptidase/L-asparaginase [Sphingomonas sp. DG1-23]|uniref:isoaspartyl peptidase/L-asparaginase family protein n=1 Tax=Sphingomonas sp. DG1-23 TaxID=3068316 RepID=UPI00273FF2F3|nr:isoaspartyl peptidase/L-asparaginase [Sphingomonas sp. DG1-23]MDP5277632.1 isoaspartyl peptidase/L-asparaginase [Sphingomonas sp. DG1-23]
MPLAAQAQSQSAQKPKWTLLIHGGAGIIEKGKLTPEQEAGATAGLDAALDAGSKVLAAGGSSLDAVQAAVQVLEDDPHFNAGRGAVFTWDAKNELDAAIMDGRNRAAGSVASTTTTRHPVAAARAVMEKSPHVMLSGAGADQFAREQGLEQVDNSWFATPERRRQLDKMKANDKLGWFDVDLKYGTVGAVAMDQDGHVAAATSTGGLTGKRWGRIGDAPIIGAGTYADDRACAVSATGAGEFFIRVGVAHEICARVRFAQQLALGDRGISAASPGAAPHAATGYGVDYQDVADAVMAEVKQLGGTGGVIVVGTEGEMVWSFNTPGMYRGRASSGGDRVVAFYGED